MQLEIELPVNVRAKPNVSFEGYEQKFKALADEKRL